MALLNSNNITQPGDGLNLNDNILNINNPNKGIYTESEFNELTENQKNSGTYFVISDTVGEDNSISELRIISNGKEVKFQGSTSDSYEWWSPNMTSDNTPEPFVVSATTSISSTHAWYAFDGNSETSWYNDSAGGYPIYSDSTSLQLVIGKNVICKGIRIKNVKASNLTPLFTLQISLDSGKTWIKYITISTLSTPTEDKWYEYYFDGPTTFNAFKFTNMSTTERYTACITEVELLIDKTAFTSKASNNSNYVMASNDILSNNYTSFMPVTTVGTMDSIESAENTDDTNNIDDTDDIDDTKAVK